MVFQSRGYEIPHSVTSKQMTEILGSWINSSAHTSHSDYSGLDSTIINWSAKGQVSTLTKAKSLFTFFHRSSFCLCLPALGYCALRVVSVYQTLVLLWWNQRKTFIFFSVNFLILCSASHQSQNKVHFSKSKKYMETSTTDFKIKLCMEYF